MAKSMPAELLEKFAADREANKAPSGKEVSGSREDTMKRAKAKAKKAKEGVFRKWSSDRIPLLVRIDV